MRIRRITVAEYYRMGEAGIFAPEERVELLDGQLIEMPPGGPPHAYSVQRVMSAFYDRFAGRAYIRVQAALTLDRWSEPEPDVMLSALPEEQYAVAHPKPSQVFLVVEVAMSSLRYDAGAKLRAYARRGVREYWVVDVEHGHVDVYREPRGERYKKHVRVERGDSVAPLSFPDDAIAVNDVLPPPR
ncbi:MAG TPA: Uma2 family endonuclease [Candidatus Elarobacter sp.]|nr:Uma2 family endonuclease [Candidatus Elarobacter sp.]HEV2737491.1 Uma2 family endonuclease [Candidatus Elarobacter sp.]